MFCVGHRNMTSQSHHITISDSNNNISVPILGYNMSIPVTVLGILTIADQDLSVKVYPSITSIVINPTSSSYTISSFQTIVAPSSRDSSSSLPLTMKTISTAISSNMIKSSSTYIIVSTSRPPSTIMVGIPSSAALTRKNWDDVIIAVLVSTVCTAVVAIVIGLIGCYGSYRYGQKNGYRVTKGNFNFMETETYLVQSVSM